MFAQFNSVLQKLQYLPVDVQWIPKQAGTVTARSFYDPKTRCYVIQTPQVEGLFMHEAGHILFQHNRYSELAHQAADLVFENQLARYFPDLKKDSPRRNEMVHYVLNMAMDCEVNSKLFSPYEQELLADTIKKTFRVPSGGIFPKDLGMEDGQSYLFYLQKMTVKKELGKEIVKQANGFTWVKELTEGQIASKLHTLARNLEKNNTMPDGSQITIYRQQTPEDYDPGSMGIKPGLLPAGAKNTAPGFGSGSGKRITVQGKHYYSLEEALHQVMPKKVKGRRSDPVYNYNRRKQGNTGVLISKYVERERYLNPAVYILVDCSGSMDRSTLDDVVTTLKNTRFHKRSKIVFWDTGLLSEVSYEDRNKIHDFPSGGGTNMALGIRYIGKTFKDDDNLIVISDFCDNLDAIEKALVDTGIRSRHLMVASRGYNQGIERIRGFNLFALK